MSKTVMRRAAALILLTSAAAFADVAAPQAAATVDDFGAPRVILTSFGYETGFTYLIFALYEHGRVAYPVPRDWSGEHYLTATLSADEERTLLANLPLNRIGSLHPSQRNGADGSNDCIHVWRDGQHAQDCIWSIDIDDWAPEGGTPPEMLRIWKQLSHFSSGRAQRWMPSSVPVAVTAARGRPCPAHAQERWPATWPIPDSAMMRRLHHGANWTFAVPSAEVPTLQRLAGWSSPTPTGCDQGVFVSDLLVDVSYRTPVPPYPHH